MDTQTHSHKKIIPAFSWLLYAPLNHKRGLSAIFHMWEHFQPHQLRAKKSQVPKVLLGFTLHFHPTWSPLLIKIKGALLIKMKGASVKHLSIRSNTKPLLDLVVSKQHRRCVTRWGWVKWGLSHLVSSFLKWPLGLWAHNQNVIFIQWIDRCHTS